MRGLQKPGRSGEDVPAWPHLCPGGLPGRLCGQIPDWSCLHPGGEVFGGVLGGHSFGHDVQRADGHRFLHLLLLPHACRVKGGREGGVGRALSLFLASFPVPLSYLFIFTPTCVHLVIMEWVIRVYSFGRCFYLSFNFFSLSHSLYLPPSPCT